MFLPIIYKSLGLHLKKVLVVSFCAPDGDERIQYSLSYGVRLGLRHASQIPNFLPEVLRLLLQTSQLVVHFRCQRHVTINILTSYQRCRFRWRCRLVPVSL